MSASENQFSLIRAASIEPAAPQKAISYQWEGIISQEEFTQRTERAKRLLDIQQKIQQTAPLLEHLL